MSGTNRAASLTWDEGKTLAQKFALEALAESRKAHENYVLSLSLTQEDETALVPNETKPSDEDTIQRLEGWYLRALVQQGLLATPT